jgi:predicted aconitase
VEDGRKKIPAVLNPAGMDRIAFADMGIDAKFAGKQEQLLKAYEKLGIRPECTCTPYYLDKPRFGDHLAWSESSAVCYANSVLGARTNREGGPSALAAALLGVTPYYGLHITENRYPTVTVKRAPARPNTGHWPCKARRRRRHPDLSRRLFSEDGS